MPGCKICHGPLEPAWQRVTIYRGKRHVSPRCRACRAGLAQMRVARPADDAMVTRLTAGDTDREARIQRYEKLAAAKRPLFAESAAA